MAAAYGYAQLPPILQDKSDVPISPINKQSSIPNKEDKLDIFYNEKIIPGGKLSDEVSFLDIIKEPLPLTKYTQIGEGNFGDVYLLEFEDKKYVLKLIKLNNPIEIQHVEQEIEILQELIGNPYTVQLLGSIIKYKPHYYNLNNSEVEYRTGTAYILYPFIPGMTLKEYQDKHEKPTTKSIEIFEKVIDAVHNLHEAGILHSDIKPDNIWIPDNPGQSPFLLDFGSSQRLYKDKQPVVYTRRVGSMNFWSKKRYNDYMLGNDNGETYPMTKGINWIALAKTLEENRNGRFKKLANAYNKNEKNLTYQELKDIIAEMRKNLSSGGRHHTKRNKQKRNKRCQNKKTKKRN